MRLPREAYPMQDAIETYLPDLRPAQQRGLALWVYGTVLAGSACQGAVTAALGPPCGPAHAHAVRQDLREWLYDGADKAATCATQVTATACFAPMLAWIVAWWHGTDRALAIDATAQRDRQVWVVVSVLYRGAAIPVAWHAGGGHPRSLACGPGQQARRLVGAAARAAGSARPGRAARLDGAGPGRSGIVESAAVDAHPPPRLAPAAAHPPRRRLPAAGGSARQGRQPRADAGTELGRGRRRLPARRGAPRRDAGGDLGGGPG